MADENDKNDKMGTQEMQPLKSAKLAKIIAIALIAVILCEGGYYLMVSAAKKPSKPAVAPAAPSASAPSSVLPPAPAAPTVPPTTEAPEIVPPQPTVSPESMGNTRASADAAPITTYEFANWASIISEKQKKYQAVSVEFTPVDEAEELTPFDNGVARIKIDGKWGFIVNGAQGWYNVSYDEIMPFSEGMAAVCSGGKWGYLSESGDFDFRNVHADCKWDSGKAYNNGYAIVSLEEKYFAINLSGETVIKTGYEKMRDYGDGLFPVQKDGKWGYIDTKEEITIPFDYEDAGSFSGGTAVVVKDGKAFCIDTTGKQITASFDDAWAFKENHTVKIKSGSKYGLINTDGTVIIQPEWDNIWNLQEGVATVQLGDKYGYVSQSDNKVVVEPKYSDVWSSAFGLIAVKADNGKWGYIDQGGNMVIHPLYDEAYNFSEGVARVRQSGKKYNLINILGESICAYNLERIEPASEGKCATVNMDGTWGYLTINYG